jgi:ribosomal-protein-alanine N-acetyltransferase
MPRFFRRLGSSCQVAENVGFTARSKAVPFQSKSDISIFPQPTGFQLLARATGFRPIRLHVIVKLEALKLRIRPATPADIAAMMALEKLSATAAHWSSAQYKEICETSVSIRASVSSSGGRRDACQTAGETPALRLALVVEAHSGVQGFAVARVLGREWEIENIVVADQDQRRGLGTRLLGELVSLARSQGAQSIFLEVRESNRAARALYLKCAFVENGHRKSYYQDPLENAILYKLDLT